MARELFSGKRNVTISEYSAGKSVKVSIEGLSKPLFMSINRTFDGEKLSAHKVSKKVVKAETDAIFSAIKGLEKALKGLKS